MYICIHPQTDSFVVSHLFLCDKTRKTLQTKSKFCLYLRPITY